MLAERISVQAINEKAPTIDHVGPWFVLQLLGLLSLRLPEPTNHKQSRARISMVTFPLSPLPPTRLTTFSRLVRSFSTQARPELLTPVTLSVETLGTYLLAKRKNNKFSISGSNYNLSSKRSSNRSTRWKRVSKPGHPIYPFLYRNLFFFLAASATVRQPRRSTPQHNQQGRGGGGGVGQHTIRVLWVDGSLIPDPQLPNCPLLAPLLRCPFLTGRSDLPNAHTGRQEISSHISRAAPWTPPMEVTGECVCGTRAYPSGIPLHLHVTLLRVPCKRLEKLSAYTYCIFFSSNFTCFATIYLSALLHPRSSRFDQWYPKNGFPHHTGLQPHPSPTRREIWG
jgi:hypothetical protein